MEKELRIQSKRLYGIDLLRIISMLMIVALHVLLQGGILRNVTTLSAEYYVAWFLECACMCTVNCYALISGYVSSQQKFRYHKIAVLWLQAVFYCFLITAMFFFVIENSVTTYEFWTNCIFPVSTNQYWYLTSYVGLFFFMPFLNALLNALSDKQLKQLWLTIVILLSVVPTVWQSDLFFTKNGYSLIWLAALYLLGGITKRIYTPKKIKNGIAIGVYFACVGIALAYKALLDGYPNPSTDAELLAKYPAPTILFAGYSLFIFAINLDIKSGKAVKMIKFFAPLSFSVYLIHTHPLVWYHLFDGAFESYADFTAAQLFFTVILTVLAIYLLCSVIDLVRYHLFRLIRLPQKLAAAEAKLEKFISDKKRKKRGECF